MADCNYNSNQGDNEIKLDLKNLSLFEYENDSIANTNDLDHQYYKIYQKAFDTAIKDKHIRNIGVTGGYGTGKSSLVHSFFKKNKSDETIFISLAHFSSLAGNTLDQNENTDKIDNILEMKIMSQLVNQIDSDKIPKANFKPKENTSKDKLKLLTIAFLCVFLYIFYFNEIFIEKLKYSFSNKIENFDWFDTFLIVSTIFFMLAIYYLTFELIKNIFSKNLTTKFSLTSMGMTLDLENKDFTDISYFDHFIADVVYIFDESDSSYIIFEDLDRFYDHTIFKKLREINILVNQRREKHRKKLMKFFYVVSDDMFSSSNIEKEINIEPKHVQTAKERTKFFDLIIPVVPILDNSNSFDYLKDEFTDEIYQDKDFEKLLFQISIFIDDFRLLKNIVNEYQIYKLVHKGHFEQNPKQLLSLIIYKSLNSTDFNLLTKAKGELFKKINLEMELNNGE
ncbi:YobI family P-loop NTPase [Streptococcus suis]